MSEKQFNKLKRNDLKRKIKFMIANDRTEIRRSQIRGLSSRLMR